MKQIAVIILIMLQIWALNADCLKNCCATLSKRTPMTYVYYQNTGHFVGGSGEWAINTKGYSGQGAGYNNPAMQCVTNTGPAYFILNLYKVQQLPIIWLTARILCTTPRLPDPVVFTWTRKILRKCAADQKFLYTDVNVVLPGMI